MGDDELEDDDKPSINESTVLRAITRNGGTVHDWPGLPDFLVTNDNGDEAIIPRGLRNGGYTESQLEIVEDHLASIGITIRPLFPH